MLHTDESFADQEIRVDSEQYVRCSFDRCVLRYFGSTVPQFQNCTFQDSSFRFSEAADRTFIFLRLLYNGGFQAVVDEAITKIKTPPAEGEIHWGGPTH